MRTTVAAALCSLACVSCATAQQFPRHRIDLHAWMPLTSFSGNPTSASDCWGHVSASGREYAVIGLSNSAAFVDITNPASPAIVGQIPHSESLWAGIKVHKNHAYVVNESGGGLQVIDLTGIDSGQVSLVRSLTNRATTAHTLAVNPSTDSLFLAGARLNGGPSAGVLIYSLSPDPGNPQSAGTIPSSAYVHEATVLTCPSGPMAGREIAFLCCGGAWLEVWDITDRGAMTRLAARTYPFARYTHQCWPSEDFRYLYINDELDETAFGLTTPRTIVFDITNLANPVYAGSFTAETGAIDHNLYVRDGFIYEANYVAGVQVFDARSDPLNPRLVGWFDTRPEEHDDTLKFAGLWSNYPFFPSGTLIGGDIQRGLFILNPSAALRCLDADVNRDAFVDAADYDQYIRDFVAAVIAADLNDDGFVDAVDLDVFIQRFVTGCP